MINFETLQQSCAKLDGILLVDKPKGITSHDVVEELRKITGIQQIGHAGTLDPFATGLLVVGLGKATRLLEYLQGERKVYHVKMQLGLITDTFDITGTVMETHEVNVEPEAVKSVILSFVGKYKQVPPAYSAKKYQGRKLYELAREGKIISLPPREVEIYSVTDLKIELPFAEFVVEVSSGTYIRSLCMDIGYALGCGATAVELRRLRVGKFRVEDSIPLSELRETRNVFPHLIRMEMVLDFPKVHVKDKQKISNGIQPKVEDLEKFDEFEKGDLVQIFHDNRLIAIAIAERSSSFIKTLIRQGRNERVLKLRKVFVERS
ncbi:tRNA pseudouridine(55) synthase TruB [Fervidobacterium thailandense]|uniref:tRNA pseudouridine synthase B n=1 Tax=Fervidobacterium thailandense TaxID=1008305 RepID=A0A1E3G6H3_9BACT|nr:tRNA pseudouridine(55) synthase TruB [Fervidobacterium thailandense]ODN31218.1 tRNA pseudouridine(55) synthase TruB [Fervidobacterium thailandense]